MPPLIATPTRPAESATCSTCGEALIRTGHITTWAETKGGLLADAKIQPRMTKAYKGWIPALLVTICPKCDSRDESSIAEPTPDKAEVDDAKRIEAIRMAYLTAKGEEPA